MACGGWQNELREIVGVLTDAVSLESCSFLKAAEMDQADSKMLEEDEHLAEILHKYRSPSCVSHFVRFDPPIRTAMGRSTTFDNLRHAKKALEDLASILPGFCSIGKGTPVEVGGGSGRGPQGGAQGANI